MSDEEIIDLYWIRNETAIHETKLKYGRLLYNISYKILQNNEDCEECVDDSYLNTWNSIPPEKPKYFLAYISKICRHICFGKLDYSNAKKRNAEVCRLTDELMECIPSNLRDKQLESNIIKNSLNDFLKELPPEKRVIFIRRYWFCEKISEISKRLDISESNVKTSLSRTRDKLKKHLEREGINL